MAGRLSLASRRTAVEEPQAKRGTLAMRPVRPTLVKGPLDSRVRGGAGACAGPTNRQPTVEKPQADGEADDEPERTDRRSKELAAQIMVMSKHPGGPRAVEVGLVRRYLEARIELQRSTASPTANMKGKERGALLLNYSYIIQH